MDIETYEKAGKLIEKIKIGESLLDRLIKIKNRDVAVPEYCSIDIRDGENALSLPESIIEKSLEHILILLKHEQEDFESDLRWL